MPGAATGSGAVGGGGGNKSTSVSLSRRVVATGASPAALTVPKKRADAAKLTHAQSATFMQLFFTDDASKSGLWRAPAARESPLEGGTLDCASPSILVAVLSDGHKVLTVTALGRVDTAWSRSKSGSEQRRYQGNYVHPKLRFRGADDVFWAKLSAAQDQELRDMLGYTKNTLLRRLRRIFAALPRYKSTSKQPASKRAAQGASTPAAPAAKRPRAAPRAAPRTAPRAAPMLITAADASSHASPSEAMRRLAIGSARGVFVKRAGDGHFTAMSLPHDAQPAFTRANVCAAAHTLQSDVASIFLFRAGVSDGALFHANCNDVAMLRDGDKLVVYPATRPGAVSADNVKTALPLLATGSAWNERIACAVAHLENVPSSSPWFNDIANPDVHKRDFCRAALRWRDAYVAAAAQRGVGGGSSSSSSGSSG